MSVIDIYTLITALILLISIIFIFLALSSLLNGGLMLLNRKTGKEKKIIDIIPIILILMAIKIFLYFLVMKFIA